MTDQEVPVRWRVLGILNGFHINGKDLYASNDWLARQLDCSERSISNAVKELEARGEVYCVRTKTSRIIKRTLIDDSQGEGSKRLLSPSQTASIPDSKQLLPNSLSNSDNIPCELGSSQSENSFIPRGAVLVPSSESGESLKPREKKETRVKDKESIYLLFSKGEQPWWRHAQQKKAALSLFDLIGYERVKAGVAFMREHLEDKYCPQAGTPFEYEEKMPALAQYVKRNKT